MSTNQISSAAVHIITGDLTDDPVACATSTNTPMAIFTVKVTRKVGEDYQTTRYRVKTYNWLASACLEYLHQGRLVQVLGNQMSVWAYTDERTGEPRGRMELVATSVIFLDRPQGSPTAMNPLPPDDIPFSPVPATAPLPVATEVPEAAIA
jgi:single-stranded DNA-binding protein